MPRIDAAMQSGKVVEWLKEEDEKITKGEAVVRVEGEKTTFEIEAPASGFLRRILCKAGSEIPVGEVLGIIEELRAEVLETPRVSEPSPAQEKLGRAPQRASHEVRASPAARALARQHGVDLTTITGTGRDGRIHTEDILRVLDRGTRTSEKLGTILSVREVIPLEGIRKAVAERLGYSVHTTVPVMLTTEVDLQALEDMRDRISSTVSLTACVVKAAARALRDHLILNSSLDEGKISVYDDINVAVAIDTPSGLIAPTVIGPEKTSVATISEQIENLRQRAISGTLAIHELTGATFTVTNLGAEGIEIFAPIINPPQAAILAVGKAAKKPIVVDDLIEIRLVATLSLIFDHRITDGVPAARFLGLVRRLLEDPESLLGHG